MFFRNDRFTRFHADEIRFTGWFARQLELQAHGLAGKLDKIWPIVGKSCWFGGPVNEAECANYWLDGFLPLGLLLKDKALIDRGQEKLASLLKGIASDGWLLPAVFGRGSDPQCSSWSYILACKMLAEYHAFSNDERIIPILRRAVEKFAEHVAQYPIGGWGKMRGFEMLIPVYHLYLITGDLSLLKLAGVIRSQCFDYQNFSKNVPREKSACWCQNTHVVNMAMAIKAGCLFSKTDEIYGGGIPADFHSEKLYAQLCRWHGTPYGHFQGDECLAGTNANQGTELCGVVEAMYSHEWNFFISGKSVWLDRLERVAFNALPAAMSSDMCRHQYDQQLNQIGCVCEDHPLWTTNGKDANIFGLEPHCGCCTANHGQGFPKLGMSAYLRSPNGILIAVPLSGSLQTSVNGKPVMVTVEGNYPFSGKIRITLKTEEPCIFDLSVRIPGFAKSAKINGENVEPGTIWTKNALWKEKNVLDVEFHFIPELQKQENGLTSVSRGPLLFAKEIASEERPCTVAFAYGPHPKPFDDRELIRTGAWAYGFSSDEFLVEEHEPGKVPFDPAVPPVVLHTRMVPVNWNLADGLDHICAPYPVTGKAFGQAEAAKLIPYGSAKLRMTLMPVIPEPEK